MSASVQLGVFPPPRVGVGSVRLHEVRPWDDGPGVFSKTKAKELRFWAGLRNDAAHGHFDRVSVEDVRKMVPGVEEFVDRYL